MRNRRDIDGELKALREKEKALRLRRKTQLGELVIATGADEFDLETLAGLLLGAVEHRNIERREGWRQRGAEFFRKRERRKPDGISEPSLALANNGTDAPVDDNGDQAG